MIGQGHTRLHVISGYFYGGTDKHNLPAYTPLSLATAAERTAFATAHPGINLGYNEPLFVVTPTQTTGGIITAARPIVGFSIGPVRSGQQVAVQTHGIVPAFAYGAIVEGSVLHVTSATAGTHVTRTTAQTPFTNLPEAIITDQDPRLVDTYVLAMVDDLSITAQSSGANLLYHTVGIALQAATAQYEIIPVLLRQTSFYA